jgi:GT2 family glycosyltransferase
LLNSSTLLSFTDGHSGSEIPRQFVRHNNPEHSPANFWRILSASAKPILSVVIPTIDSDRDGRFIRLLEQIDNQNMTDYELIVVRGDPRQGRAINIGVAIARGKYLLTLDDDTSLPCPDTFSKLVSAIDSHTDIGIAGGNNLVPDDASSFVRRAMQEIPRRYWEPVQTITDSDLAEHPCMIMRMEEFKAVGGENELIPRGLDPYLREQFRKIGKRVVVVPNVIYHHLPPNTLPKLLSQFYRNGRHAAYTNLFYPQWVIETPAEHGAFRSKVPFSIRILRFPVRAIGALIAGKPIWFLAQVMYGFGFIREYLKYRSGREPRCV